MFEMVRLVAVPLLEYTKGMPLLEELSANMVFFDVFVGLRKITELRSAAIRMAAERASRVASVLRLALAQALDI